MKNIQEDIRIFQDAKNNKTTVVIYNMSEATKQKLAQILLSDVQTVETIEHVNCTAPDMSAEVQSTEGMTPVVNIDALIAGKNAPQALEALANCYLETHQMNILTKINEIINSFGEIGAMDDNTLRGVLYLLRNVYPQILNSLTEQLGFGNPSGAANRDAMIQQALMNANTDTLNAALTAITN